MTYFHPLDIQKSETAHSLRPMSIYQLIQASQAHTDADWVLDDQEIGQVNIIILEYVTYYLHHPGHRRRVYCFNTSTGDE